MSRDKADRLVIDARNFGLVLLLALFLGNDLLIKYVSPVWGYFDELFAALAIPVVLFSLRKTGSRLRNDHSTVLTIFFLALFALCGFVGTFVNRYMPAVNTMLDLFALVKYFLAVTAARLLFRGFDMDGAARAIWNTLRPVTAALFVFAMADVLTGAISHGEVRLGVLHSVKLIFSIYTILAEITVLMAAVYVRLYQYYGRRVLPYLIMTLAVMASTLRYKAFGAAIMIVFIYLTICRRRRNPGVLAWTVLIAVMAAATVGQFIEYYANTTFTTPRDVLQSTALQIAREYFPFGTGFATFATAFSVTPYSPVYYIYHIDAVWGLSPTYYAFITDTFWPMLLAETGVLGLGFYIAALAGHVRRVLRIGRVNACGYASALVLLGYFFIASSSETAFASSYAAGFGMWIGVQLEDADRRRRMT